MAADATAAGPVRVSGYAEAAPPPHRPRRVCGPRRRTDSGAWGNEPRQPRPRPGTPPLGAGGELPGVAPGEIGPLAPVETGTRRRHGDGAPGRPTKKPRYREASEDGSDGTRTRDLRRDRPAL